MGRKSLLLKVREVVGMEPVTAARAYSILVCSLGKANHQIRFGPPRSRPDKPTPPMRTPSTMGCQPWHT